MIIPTQSPQQAAQDEREAIEAAAQRDVRLREYLAASGVNLDTLAEACATGTPLEAAVALRDYNEAQKRLRRADRVAVVVKELSNANHT